MTHDGSLFGHYRIAFSGDSSAMTLIAPRLMAAISRTEPRPDISCDCRRLAQMLVDSVGDALQTDTCQSVS